ncbi:MAG: 4-hydroxy-3-methylbut-2-enyl diphosphate reductase [Pseudomonadota bacterium]
MKHALKILLCAPRGFCAGVDRAIQIVELALEQYGAPVYVRHEIVHNQHVVNNLKDKGAIFVEELEEIPDTEAPVIFSAHGVPKSVPAEAQKRNFFYLDATCPLVSKVHIEAENHSKEGLEVLLIGHANHPEVIGTMGQVPNSTIKLIETLEDARQFTPSNSAKLAYVTQTTLSVDDTREIITVLKQRFPSIKEPKKDDICYATTNRQEAVKSIASLCDTLIVVGAPNSSNSKRLVEVGQRAGCERSYLIQDVNELDWNHFTDTKVLGITAGASAPEILVENIVDAFKDRFSVTLETITTAQENVVFKLPRELRKTPSKQKNLSVPIS